MVGMVLATNGCNVGPDFVRPKVALNEKWKQSEDPRLKADAKIDTTWWRTFDDPTLDQLVDIAAHENLTLQIAGLRILEARGLLGIAVGEQYPTNLGPAASASADHLSADAPNQANLDHNYGSFQVGFDAVWEIDFWGKFRRGVKAADGDYLATVADYDDAVVSLTAEVARTYVQIRTFEALIDLAQQNVALQEEGQQIAQSRFTNGATSELDVDQATNLLETTRGSIPKLQLSLQQSQNALSTLLGRPTGYVQLMLTESRGIPKPPDQVAVSLPAELIRRRPDIRGAELRAYAQCQRIGVAKADLYPSFSLMGAFGTSTSVGTSNAAPLFDPSSFFANIGGGVFWPILNYPKIQANIHVQDARFQEALVTYAFTVLKAAQEVDDGIVGYLRQQDAVVFEQNAVTAAQTAVELALVQYREGSVDYQRVLDSQRVLLGSQNDLTNTRSAATTNLIALYKALGGGWEVRKNSPVINERTNHDLEERSK